MADEFRAELNGEWLEPSGDVPALPKHYAIRTVEGVVVSLYLHPGGAVRLTVDGKTLGVDDGIRLRWEKDTSHA